MWKKHVENLEMRGYDDIGDCISNADGGYMPEGWSVIWDGDESTLKCKKCTKKDCENDNKSRIVAVA